MVCIRKINFMTQQTTIYHSAMQHLHHTPNEDMLCIHGCGRVGDLLSIEEDEQVEYVFNLCNYLLVY